MQVRSICWPAAACSACKPATIARCCTAQCGCSCNMIAAPGPVCCCSSVSPLQSNPANHGHHSVGAKHHFIASVINCNTGVRGHGSQAIQKQLTEHQPKNTATAYYAYASRVCGCPVMRLADGGMKLSGGRLLCDWQHGQPSQPQNMNNA